MSEVNSTTTTETLNSQNDEPMEYANIVASVRGQLDEKARDLQNLADQYSEFAASVNHASPYLVRRFAREVMGEHIDDCLNPTGLREFFYEEIDEFLFWFTRRVQRQREADGTALVRRPLRRRVAAEEAAAADEHAEE